MSRLPNQLKLAIYLKLEKLRRENNPNLVFENIEDTLVNYIWKNQLPIHLSVAIEDIMNLSSEQIVQFMSYQAIIDGYNSKLSDFKDVIEGGITR
ncbi:MAG: post-transcriptional regulator [Erysipelotrichaceae bacterium]|nr:post-transcriptional regulator [Erysipelotrichaceae bacterium]MDY5252469.1 post-transcriptional regulator [Erysipelotrichaceae bacterium]